MKVITNSEPFFVVIPRLYPVITDALALTFENGMSIAFSWEVTNKYLLITLEDTSSFKQRENYSFTILSTTDIIYKGKMIFLKDDTDVQNYTNQSQDNKRYKK